MVLWAAMCHFLGILQPPHCCPCTFLASGGSTGTHQPLRQHRGLLYRVPAPFGQRERSENGRDGLTHVPSVLKWVSFMWQREFPSFAFFPKVV